MRGNCHQNKNLRIVSILFDFLNFNLVKSLYCTVLYCTALYQTELHCILPAIVECQLNLPLFSLSHCKNNVLLLILLCQCQCLNFWQYILFESTPILTYLVIFGRMTIISVSDIAFSEILSIFKSIPQTQYPDFQKHVLKSHQIGLKITITKLYLCWYIVKKYMLSFIICPNYKNRIIPLFLHSLVICYVNFILKNKKKCIYKTRQTINCHFLFVSVICN